MMRSNREGTLDHCLRRLAGKAGYLPPLAEAPGGRSRSLESAGSVLDVSASLRDRPRPIDRYIDYFGGAVRPVCPV